MERSGGLWKESNRWLYITRKINYKENIISSSFSELVIYGLSLHVTDSVKITEISLKHL